MNTVNAAVKSTELERLLDTTVSQHGYWLVNHIEAIESDLLEALKKFGYTMTVELLDAHQSPYVQGLYKKIEEYKDSFKNITVKIDAAEGFIDVVDRITKLDYTNRMHEISNRLSALYEPEAVGYNKVYLLVKDNNKEIRVRFDLARNEDTPASVILQLIKHDKELSEVQA